MANHASTAGLRQLRTLFVTGTAAGLTDAQLLERVTAGTRAADTADAAFAALMARHGGMVLGVCRRILSDPQDIEDAFQATFLVLVRKSAGIRVDDSLGRWLYGVARRVAYRARSMAKRRQARECSPASPAWEPALSGPDVERAELLAALDDELGRLPEKYRAAVLLCDLEGLTHTEAALRLQWPLGTVKGRLAQARTLLRTRLTRRGLAPSALFLATVIKAEAGLVVPPSLARRTVRLALQSAIGGKAGATLASASAVALSRGVLKAMLWTKLRMIAIGLAAALATTVGAAGFAEANREDATLEREANLGADPTGDQRPANAVAIVSDVESDTKVIALAPDGLKVRRGDVVCRLDTAALNDQLSRQKIATSGAEAAYQNAKLTREVAEIALTEYREGIYKQELETIKGEIALAESERKRAEDRLEWSNKMRAKGYVSRDQNTADKIKLDRKVFSREQAETKRMVLEKYTYTKTVKKLQSDVEKARADEQAREQVWNREKAAQAKIENQIEHCRIVAPVSGRLIHARWPVPGAKEQTTIEKGMTVHWAQLLFWVIPSPTDRGTDRSR